MNLLAWARLLRLSLAPSAAADVACGLLLGGLGHFPLGRDALLAIVASLAVYHGGMALNDWADRDEDARARRERPIPSGAISARAAGTVGFALLVLAVLAAAAISWRAAAWMSGIAGLVLAYDLFARGPWIGPLLLGACRAANIGFGLAYASTFVDPPRGALNASAVLLAVSYGAYVFCASRVARFEDVSDESSIGSRPRAWLFACAVMLCVPAILAPFELGLRVPDLVVLALTLGGAFALASTAWRTHVWSRADAGRATGLALRRLLVFTAAGALSMRSEGFDAWYVALAILAGFPLSAALRRVVPPT